MTYLGPGSPGLEITTASVTIDPALASADPGTMATAARSFAAAGHQIQGAGQASVRASAQLSADWSGKGKDGFDAASSKLNAGAKLGADAMAATSRALQTLSIEIAAAKAMAQKAQMMATDSARAATMLQSAYAASSQQAVQALPPDATTEQALAARAPTAGQVAQANTISTDAAHATQLMAQANFLARQAWDKAAAAFQAVTATSPTRTAQSSGHAHPKAKVSLDQVRIVTQADGQRVYSFDGGLKIPADMPGAHRLVEDIKAYMPRFLAGDHGGIEVPAGLSAKGLWFVAASIWVTTTMHDIPQELRNVFFTARFSALTMTDLIAMGLTTGGVVGGAAYAAGQTDLFSGLFNRAPATPGGSSSFSVSVRDRTPTSSDIPTTAGQVTDQQTTQADDELGTQGAKAGNAPQIKANQADGNAARDAIAARYPGAETEVTFETELGIRRVDVLTPDNVAIESKVGYTPLTQSVQTQIAKDQWLAHNGYVNGVKWEFTPSGVTGRVGPSGPLASALEKAGIPWSIGP